MEHKDALTWFEIPAADLARATRFYETVLAGKLKSEAMGPRRMSIFPYSEPGVGGALMESDGPLQSANATLVYLWVARLDEALERVGRAGGTIALPRTPLPEGMGHFAHIIDSEGNRVGLHSLH